MKALLFELVRSFEFKLAVPADDVVGQMGYVLSRIEESPEYSNSSSGS